MMERIKTWVPRRRSAWPQLIVALLTGCALAGGDRCLAWQLATPPPSVRFQGPQPAEELTAPLYEVPLRAADSQLVVRGEDGLVSLVARDAPLQSVLTALAEMQGLNLVTQQAVNAQITTTLNQVPLEDALDAILATSGYTWVRHRNIIQVTSLSGEQKLAPETQDRRVAVFHLDYVSATDVNTVVSGMLSPVGRSSVVESAADDNRRTQEVLVVEDIPRYLSLIREYVAQHDVAPRQVLVEAYILQVELSDDLKHGVNFEHLFQVRNNLFELEARNLAQSSASQAFMVNLSGGNLGAVVEMLETAVDAKTLASPKIRVLNGQTARIQVGEQLGFRVTTTTQTSTMETVQFLDVGVVLEVTPRIGSDGTVIMRVKPEVSSGRVNPNTGLPEEETTEIETDVLFHDNQAYVIGGLIQEADQNAQNKLPHLGDLKYLGRLFQRREETKRRTEIIMALLPRVMPFDVLADMQLQEETERARTPLFCGPLQRYPRPWEPQLPDAVYNPAPWRLPPITHCLPAPAGRSIAVGHGLSQQADSHGAPDRLGDYIAPVVPAPVRSPSGARHAIHVSDQTLSSETWVAPVSGEADAAPRRSWPSLNPVRR